MPGTFEIFCSVVTRDDRVVELRWTVSCEIRNDARFLRGLMMQAKGIAWPQALADKPREKLQTICQ